MMYVVYRYSDKSTASVALAFTLELQPEYVSTSIYLELNI